MFTAQCDLDDRIAFETGVFAAVGHNPYYLSVSSDLGARP